MGCASGGSHRGRHAKGGWPCPGCDGRYSERIEAVPVVHADETGGGRTGTTATCGPSALPPSGLPLFRPGACCADASSATASAARTGIRELFVFVAQPEVPSDNNTAERSLRPVMVSRKISGGTRSNQGTDTKMTLASVFGTGGPRLVPTAAGCRQLLVPLKSEQLRRRLNADG